MHKELAPHLPHLKSVETELYENNNESIVKYMIGILKFNGKDVPSHTTQQIEETIRKCLVREAVKFVQHKSGVESGIKTNSDSSDARMSHGLAKNSGILSNLRYVQHANQRIKEKAFLLLFLHIFYFICLRAFGFFAVFATIFLCNLHIHKDTI